MAGRRIKKRLNARSAQKAKDKLLAAYAEHGTISAAAEHTGINRHHHKYWMKTSADYRKAFQEADDQAFDVLEREARRRAVEGRLEPVFYNGQQVGTIRKWSDLLLIFLMKAKRPDVYRDSNPRINNNVLTQTAVKVVHEYHDAPVHADVTAIEQLPNRALMGPVESLPAEPTSTPDPEQTAAIEDE